MSTQGGSSNQQKRPTVVVYPTVAPETIVIPIVSCILGFPLLALMVICCLRRRAKLARERDRRRAGNCETETGAISLARFSPMHKLGVYLAGPSVSGRARAVSLRSERALSPRFSIVRIGHCGRRTIRAGQQLSNRVDQLAEADGLCLSSDRAEEHPAKPALEHAHEQQRRRQLTITSTGQLARTSAYRTERRIGTSARHVLRHTLDQIRVSQVERSK